jgi:phosphatidylglycerophosphatase A
VIHPRRSAEVVAIPLATLFGAGRSPVAPGTAGTLATLPLAVIAALLLPPWGFLVATAGLALLGIWSSGAVAGLLRRHDPGCVVIDEAAGLFATLLFQPITPAVCAGAFLMFRVMDVLKPPPARQAEGLPGGLGIVADDLVAGLYANLALRAAGALWRALRT